MSYRQGQIKTRVRTGKTRYEQDREKKKKVTGRTGKDRLRARTGRDKDGLGQQKLDANLSG